jgi:hypothetical protein
MHIKKVRLRGYLTNMPIFIGSRYAGLPITTIRNYEGELKQYIHLREAIKQMDITEDYILYTVQQGEVLDQISYQYYKEERFWWMLAEINNLVYPYNLYAGQNLIIPNQRFAERVIA